jgi:hypothetical protein
MLIHHCNEHTTLAARDYLTPIAAVPAGPAGVGRCPLESLQRSWRMQGFGSVNPGYFTG